MSNKTPLFDNEWLLRAKEESSQDSWAHTVMETFDTSGEAYLNCLRLWFEKFPLTAKQKRNLHSHIESFKNADHLGGVNELAWWKYMLNEGLTAIPLPASPSRSSPQPDFQVTHPVEYFVEVTTLNISKEDRAVLINGEGVSLNDDETLNRVIGKFTEEKKRQLLYAADKRKPGVLVLFDYTEWSGFGAQFFRFLAESLLGNNLGFIKLPNELSALVYIVRSVKEDGHIAFSRRHSAVYYNPFAKHPLPPNEFPSLNRFRCEMTFEEASASDWIML